jgi:hypothetical protein
MPKTLRRWQDAMRRSWCLLFHDAPMCPLRGEWQCRVCLLKHPVRFHQDLTPPRVTAPREEFHNGLLVDFTRREVEQV